MPTRPAKRRPPYRVFVSHATADKGIVLLLGEKIDALRGVTTFRDDRDIAGGEVIPAKLLEALEASDEMLVLLTPAAVQSLWVMHEVGAFWAMRQPIVPVFHQVEPGQFPPLVKDVKAYRLQDFDQYLADLRGRARGPRK